MQTFLAATIFFGLAMAIMAVGVVFSGRTLKGSCGGPGGSCSCSPTRSRRCHNSSMEDGEE